MFSNLYKSIFKERINEFTALNHLHDPEWFDTNWDKLLASFYNNTDFRNFIECNLLMNPEIEMLNVLIKHEFSFLGTILVSDYRISMKYSTYFINLEVFKLIIDNKRIFKDEDLCKILLTEADQMSFEKFKYAFEAGFPFSIECPITITDIKVAEQIWQYLNNSRNIEVKYTIGNNIFNITFLKDYIEWIKLHKIEDSLLFFISISVAKTLGIPGLRLLLQNGYIKKALSFDSKNYSQEVVDWLLLHGFQEIHYNRKKIYHTKEIMDLVEDEVNTEKII